MTDGIDTATGTVTIDVTNASPTSANDIYHVDAETPLIIDAEWGVLANDKDADDVLTVTVVTGPQHGTLTLNADGSFEYTPGQSFAGSDSFTYEAEDGIGVTSSGTVYFTSGVAARNDHYDLDHNMTFEVDLYGGVLANDDIFDLETTVAIITGPTHGDLALNSDGSFTFDPDTGYIGSDQFTYEIEDEIGYTTATVTLNIYNIAPVGIDDSYDLYENTSLTVSAANGVLANDFDDEGDTLTATLVHSPLYGTVVLNGDGSFEYTRDAGYTGPDSFYYKLQDGTEAASSPIRVHFVAQAPAMPTVSGQLRYDPVNPKPVRNAVIELQAQYIGHGWRPIDETATNMQGNYSLNVTDTRIWARAYRFVIFAENPNTDRNVVSVGAHLPTVVNRMLRTKALIVDLPRPIPAGGIVQNEVIGDATESHKAFWTFDAALTANRAFQLIQHEQHRPTNVTVVYSQDLGTAVNLPRIIHLQPGGFKDWDTICHEYGHIVQVAYNFLPVSASFTHQLERNARLDHRRDPIESNNRLAFREGFADFFSMLAQETDSAAPLRWEYNATLHHKTRDMRFYDYEIDLGAPWPSATPSPGRSNGEDEEVTVMRILWDLFDTNPPPLDLAFDIGMDNVGLGFDGVMNLILNQNLNSNQTAVATTLGRLWENIRVTRSMAAAMPFASVFQLNNVAPWVDGMYVNNTSVTQWAVGNPVPEFRFDIPKSETWDGTLLILRLLDRFQISFYNDDYSNRLFLEDNQANFTIDGRTVRWTPLTWGSIQQPPGTRIHCIISGRLFGSWTYWSAPLDITFV